MPDNTDTTNAWLSSPTELVERVRIFGTRHGLSEALITRAAPVLETCFRVLPTCWRLRFPDPAWHKLRRGDGRLAGDEFTGGWGVLEFYITWPTWEVDLRWVKERFRNHEMADPHYIADSYLGLRLQGWGDQLLQLPDTARLELTPEFIEFSLLEWASLQQPVAITAATPLDIRVVAMPDEVTKALAPDRQSEPANSTDLPSEQPHSQIPRASKDAVKPARQRGGLDFRASDDRLAAEIIAGMRDKDGDILSDWTACDALVSQTMGRGSLLSRQKRLFRRVRRMRGEDSGQR
jgi:hypothetical protein